MPISTTALVDWASEQVLSLDPFPFRRGPWRPDYDRFGDRVGLISMSSGLGEDVEGVLYRPSFQVFMRSHSREADSLEKSVFEMDRFLRFGNYPHELWGTRTLEVTWSGGAPETLEEDGPELVSYVCTYIITAVY